MGSLKKLKMTEDDIQLVAESCSKSIKDSFVPALAKRLGVKPSNLRMRRAKLLWQIRRKLYEKIGKRRISFFFLLLIIFRYGLEIKREYKNGHQK